MILIWTHSRSDDFKLLCDSRNLFQLVDTPTRPNLKFPEKSTLIDLVFTNVPHKYSSVSVFANDVSDHCVVAVARDMKLHKQNSRIITRRFMKYFNEQAFLYDLAHIDWDKITLIPDVDCAWDYFYNGFMSIINKHAPLKKHRVKHRDNPWFSAALYDLIEERDVAWAKARQTHLDSDWLHFRQLRNKCTLAIRKSKSDNFLDKTEVNLTNPRKMWKNNKFLTGTKTYTELPPCTLVFSTSCFKFIQQKVEKFPKK